jgi:hypothetical protein
LPVVLAAGFRRAAVLAEFFLEDFFVVT